MWNVGDVLTASDVNVYLAALSGVKSANQIVNLTTTLINDADMRFPIAANSLYEFHTHLRYATPLSGDWKTSFTVPAGASAKFNFYGRDLSGVFGDTTIEYTDASSVTSQGRGAGTLMCSDFWGFITTTGTAGNLILQWAPNTSNAGNTTLFQNSYLTGRRIG